MNGLELAEKYYREVVGPMIKQEFPDLASRTAAGLVGEGSECYGFDDELSKDHDWGAKVCLWLNADDYRNYGRIIQEKLMRLPDTFEGYPVCWIQGRNGVLEIRAFFQKYLNSEGVPQTIGQWLHVPDCYLSVASNGRIFEDPSGEFSAIWKELRMGYPEDIRLKKMAARCMAIGQSGQYNYPRLKKRKDPVAMSLAMSEFIKNVISVVYLLNNQYAPFYKWAYYGMRRLPKSGWEISEKLAVLIAADEKQPLIEEICSMLIMEFKKQGISDCMEEFMIRQGESIHRHIRNDGLRNSDPWMEV